MSKGVAGQGRRRPGHPRPSRTRRAFSRRRSSSRTAAACACPVVSGLERGTARCAFFPQLGGRVLRILAEIGAPVKAGQALAIPGVARFRARPRPRGKPRPISLARKA